jgi:ubiquinone/menaquinone biosynthesis C-methylase UbiE
VRVISLRSVLSKIEPESIPFPFSRLYGLLSSTRMFMDYYNGVASQVIKRCPSGRILDIGTGPGNLPIIIGSRNKYVHVTGIDLSGDMVKTARSKAIKKGLDNVEFKKADVAGLPFNDREFDLVISTLSFHHWKDTQEALDEIYRVLNEKGEAWIYDIPKKMSMERFVRLKKKYGTIRAWLFRLHSFTEPFYDEKGLKEVAESSRFKKFKIEYYGITYKLVLNK